MSEKPDKDSKTELASEKKRDDARRKGNVPVSREPANLAYLAAGLLAFGLLFERCATGLSHVLAGLLQEAGGVRIGNEAEAVNVLQAIGWDLFVAVGPLLLTFALSGVGAAVLQNPPIPVISRITPEFSRISVIRGLTRLFGMMGLLEMAKTVFRFAAFIGCCIMLIQYVRAGVQNAILMDPVSSLFLTRNVVLVALVALLAVSAVILVLDLPMARIVWLRELRMTRQEVKDEHKDAEGDANIKARRRSIARSRLRQRNLAAVQSATVVITNPTHFAVALRYIREEGGAPMVVAKGQDLIALQIRRIAEGNSIPIIEDKLLARSLYAKVDVDQMIPVEFYRIVAEILIRLQARRNPVRAR